METKSVTQDVFSMANDEAENRTFRNADELRLAQMGKWTGVSFQNSHLIVQV